MKINSSRGAQEKILAGIDRLKSALSLDCLNEVEERGCFSHFSSLKFIKRTSINVSFNLGRSIRGVDFKNCFSVDPFGILVKMLSESNESEKCLNFLYQCYLEESQKNAAEILGLTSNRKLSQYPAWALVLPWENFTIDEKNGAYEKTFFYNRIRHLSSESDLASISSEDLGFYSLNNAKSQILQTSSLLRSINSYGLLASPSLPRIVVLRKDRFWRWLMSGEGNHRAYISSLLGYRSLKVVVDNVVFRDEAKAWNNVRNGTFSVEEALTVFDAFFNGQKCLRGIV